MSNNKKTEEAVDESLHFEKITWDNFEAIINLHVKKEQQNYVLSEFIRARSLSDSL